MLLNNDFAGFRHRFETRLAEMLNPDQVGAFILVLANSMQSHELHAALAPKLAETFAAMRENWRQGRLQGGPDDLEVFAALARSGIDQYGAWTSKSLGDWRVAFNPLRALRPQRASAERFSGLSKEFDEQRFHFDKAFLQPEVLAEEHLDGQTVRVMYQKFPFASYHLLVVLNARQHLPQFMTERALKLSREIVARAGERIQGFGLAYNSLGASASVNHLHVHGFVDPSRLAIENPRWRHNGGADDYPVLCHRLASASECWQLVDDFNRNNQPYNLLLRTSSCYLVPRAVQATRALPAWMPDAAWYEICGGFNLLQRSAFDHLQASDIERGLAQLSI